MAYLSLTPHVSQIRVYDEPDGYEKRLPYSGIMTVSYLNDTTVYLSAAHGNFDMETFKQVMDLLKSHGVRTLYYERRGKFVSRDLEPDQAIGAKIS